MKLSDFIRLFKNTDISLINECGKPICRASCNSEVFRMFDDRDIVKAHISSIYTNTVVVVITLAK